jgi:hypothetical protein
MNDRGQTVLDFAVGVSVFLIVVAFVLTFVPGMVQPFQESTQEETAAADRLADQLAADQLAENVSTPYVLDRECTVAFFEDSSDNEDGDTDFDGVYDDSSTFEGPCNFPDLSLSERLAVTGSGLDIRVRLVADLGTAAADDPDGDRGGNDDEIDTLCLDTGDRQIVEANDPGGGRVCDPGSADVVFTIGDTPPSDRSSVVAARRHVSVNGGFADGSNDALLIVEVW